MIPTFDRKRPHLTLTLDGINEDNSSILMEADNEDKEDKNKEADQEEKEDNPDDTTDEDPKEDDTSDQDTGNDDNIEDEIGSKIQAINDKLDNPDDGDQSNNDTTSADPNAEGDADTGSGPDSVNNIDINDDTGDVSQADDNAVVDDDQSIEPDDTEKENNVLKNQELKANFIEIYNMSNDLIERINKLTGLESQEVQALDFVSTQLYSLKDLIVGYVENTFDSKSYMNNRAYLRKCIAIFEAILKIIDSCSKSEKA